MQRLMLLCDKCLGAYLTNLYEFENYMGLSSSIFAFLLVGFLSQIVKGNKEERDLNENEFSILLTSLSLPSSSSFVENKINNPLRFAPFLA